MKIREHSESLMIVTRGRFLDRFLFSVFIAAGVGLLLFGGEIEAPPWFRFALAALFIGGGGYFWMLSAAVTVTLDRRAGTARVDWARLLSRVSRTARLDDIVELIVERSGDADRLTFKLADGSTLPLVPYNYTGGDHPEIKRAVDDWLAG